MNRMEELGIDVSQMSNEGFNIYQNIRDFKIKILLQNEGN